MPLADYLAKNYLNATPAPGSSNKKRKRKQTKEVSSGLTIADDDALGWTSQPTEADEDDSRPLSLSTGSAEFRKAKKSSWKTVGVPAPKDSEQDAADRIINQAAAENASARQLDEEPVVEDEGVVKMGDGTHAGLQSAADVTRQMEKRKQEEKEAWEREAGKFGKGSEETVYRDATGRRIDISMRRAAAAKEADEKAKLEREAKEAQKGDVQLAEREKKREMLDEARFIGVARKVDDEDMNKELREVERWNDPAAQFVSKKEVAKGRGGKPLYKGAAAPNRYGIRPGHRWDGVDRGNGWEGERFKAMNRVSRNKDLEYTWQMDE